MAKRKGKRLSVDDLQKRIAGDRPLSAFGDFLARQLPRLPTFEEAVLRLRFGLKGQSAMSQAELSYFSGLTVYRIRTWERRGIGRLQGALEAELRPHVEALGLEPYEIEGEPEQ